MKQVLWHHHWIDFAPELLVGLGECVNDDSKRYLSYNKDIYIAGDTLLPLRDRAENERGIHLGSQWRKRFAQYVREPDRLSEDASKLRENRAVAIGPVAYLVTGWLPQQNPRLGKELQFTVQRTRRHLRHASDFPHVVALVRMHEQQTQDAPMVAAEERLRRVCVNPLQSHCDVLKFATIVAYLRTPASPG